MKKQFVKLTVIAVLIALSVSAFAQESVDLKYGFVKGKTYIQNMQQTQNSTQTMGEQEMKIATDSDAKVEYAIEEVAADGNATVLVKALESTMHQSGMGMDTTITTKDMNYSNRVVISATGKSLSSETVDSSEVSKLVNQMDPGKLKLLPGRLVQVGEKWQENTVENKNVSSALPLAMEIKSDTEYNLVGKENTNGNEHYRISYSTSLTVTGKVTYMGMDMFIEGAGKTEGFSLFNPKTSMIVRSEENSEMQMNVAVTGQQSITIPVTQSIKTVMTFTEKQQ